MQIDTLAHLTTPRYNHIKHLIESFPKRRFVLIGDTATGSVLSAYGALAREFPHQIQCVLIRDVSATEPADWIVPNLKALPENTYITFATPEDLRPDSKALMERLANGESVGCGNLTSSNPMPRRLGGLASWVATIRNGVYAYAQCFLQFEFRPSDACIFDRVSN